LFLDPPAAIRHGFARMSRDLATPALPAAKPVDACPAAGRSAEVPLAPLVRTAIRGEALDAAALEDFVESLPGVGGVCVFKGNIRPLENGQRIESMEYEHYAGMAERELERVAREAAATPGVLAVAVEHRVGAIPVGEAAVMIAVGAAHRAESFEACRQVIEAIKQRVPIWKRSDAGPGRSDARPDEEGLVHG
jgi:molybdopterin synthase catalytic subunit